eukprot:394045_1
MSSEVKSTAWNCDGCTFENDSSQNPDRCAMCNTHKDYLTKKQKSTETIVNTYKQKYGNELLSYFYPYPDTKGCNTGDTAVHCILDHALYLSGSYTAQDLKWLKENGINAILNCAATDIQHSEKVYSKESNILLKQLPIHDSSKWQSVMNQYIEEGIAFITECVNTKKMKVPV